MGICHTEYARHPGGAERLLIFPLDALLAYLEQADASGFAAKLECLLHSEVTFAAEQLVRVGIQEASGVLY